MEKLIHPISGETGYFATEREKNVIDAVLKDFLISQFVLQVSSRSESERCGL